MQDTAAEAPPFHEVIKEKRRRRGLSQTVLGDLVGMSAATVHRIEYGEKIPTDGEAEMLAGALGLDALALVTACAAARVQNRQLPRTSYKQEWDYAHPASYAGRVWVQVHPQPNNRSLPHEYTLRWGPWLYRGRLDFAGRKSLSLSHYKFNDGEGRPLIFSITPACYVVFGKDAAPDQPPIDIVHGWQRAQPHSPGQALRFAASYLWMAGGWYAGRLRALLGRKNPV